MTDSQRVQVRSVGEDDDVIAGSLTALNRDRMGAAGRHDSRGDKRDSCFFPIDGHVYCHGVVHDFRFVDKSEALHNVVCSLGIEQFDFSVDEKVHICIRKADGGRDDVSESRKNENKAEAPTCILVRGNNHRGSGRPDISLRALWAWTTGCASVAFESNWPGGPLRTGRTSSSNCGFKHRRSEVAEPHEQKIAARGQSGRQGGDDLRAAGTFFCKETATTENDGGAVAKIRSS